MTCVVSSKGRCRIALTGRALISASFICALVAASFDSWGQTRSNNLERSEDNPTLMVQLGHSTDVSSLAVSKDGKFLMSGSRDSNLLLWDVASGAQLTTLLGHHSEVRQEVFVPGGNSAVSIDKQGSIHFWRLDGTSLLPTINAPFFEDKEGSLEVAALSPDGRYSFVNDTSCCNAGSYLVSLQTGAAKIFTDKLTRPISAAFSADGASLVMSDYQFILSKWDVCVPAKKIGSHRFPNANPNRGEMSVGVSPDGRYVLAGQSSDVPLILWDTATDSIRSFDIHEVAHFRAGYHRLAFDSSGRHAISILSEGNRGGIAVYWDVETGKPVWTVYRIRSAAFLSDDYVFLGLSSGEIEKVRSLDGQVAQVIRGSALPVTSVAFSRDRKYLAAGTIEPAVKVFELWNHGKFREFVGHRGSVNSVAFTPSGNRLLSASEDSTVIVWDTNSWKQRWRFIRHHQSVQSVAVSPNGKLVVSGSRDSNLWLWSPGNQITPRQIVTARECCNEYNRSIAFSSDSSSFSSNIHEGELDIWDSVGTQTKHWTVTDQLPGDSPESIYAITFSPEGKHFAYGVEGGRVVVLDTFTWAPSPPMKMSGSVESLQFMPDGKSLLVGTFDGRLTMNALGNAAKNRDFVGHYGSVRALSLSTDGKYLASGSLDGTIKIWNTRSRKNILTLALLPGNGWISVAPDGRFDASNLENMAAAHWIFPGDRSVPLAPEIFMRDYYEPQLLSKLLDGTALAPLPEITSLAELNRNQPVIGEITVIPDEEHSELVTVKVKASSVAGQCVKGNEHVPCESGVYDLRLYRDGQLVAQKPAPAGELGINKVETDRQRQLQQWRAASIVRDDSEKAITASNGEREITFSAVRLPQRSEVTQVHFTAYAFNEDRVKSATSRVQKFSLPKHQETAQRHAFVITMAVDVTSDPEWRLSFAPGDANTVQKLLKDKLPSSYKIIPVPLISAWQKGIGDATKERLQSVLRVLSRQGTALDKVAFPQLQPATPDDLVVLYIASHGYVDPQGAFYVIPSDIGEPNGVSEKRLNRCLSSSEQSLACQEAREFLGHSISSDELTQWLQAIDAGDMVLILDSCHSGAVTGPRFKPGPMGDRSFGQLSYDKRMRVLAATQSDSSAWGSLQQGDTSVLTMALTAAQANLQPFDVAQWLNQASLLVPQLYNKYIPNQHQHQQPVLFDFTTK
jgi:WD40 repeat protein